MLPDGRTLKTVFVPDPTEAMRRVLETALDSEPLEITIAIERLVERIPVLEGGSYCASVRERMKQNAEARSDVIAPAVAHALRRLEVGGTIILKNLADAPRRMTMPDDSDTGRIVSHVALASNQGVTNG
jgi:hypothetical protein